MVQNKFWKNKNLKQKIVKQKKNKICVNNWNMKIKYLINFFYKKDKNKLIEYGVKMQITNFM